MSQNKELAGHQPTTTERPAVDHINAPKPNISFDKSDPVPPECRKVMRLLIEKFGYVPGQLIPFGKMYDFLKLYQITKPQASRALDELEARGKIQKVPFQGVKIK